MLDCLQKSVRNGSEIDRIAREFIEAMSLECDKEFILSIYSTAFIALLCTRYRLA